MARLLVADRAEIVAVGKRLRLPQFDGPVSCRAWLEGSSIFDSGTGLKNRFRRGQRGRAPNCGTDCFLCFFFGCHNGQGPIVTIWQTSGAVLFDRQHDSFGSWSEWKKTIAGNVGYSLRHAENHTLR